MFNFYFCDIRKCRATDEGDDIPKRKVRTLWDVDSSRTSALLEDMGVSVLSDPHTGLQVMCVDSEDDNQVMSSPEQPTPEITVMQHSQPPPVCLQLWLWRTLQIVHCVCYYLAVKTVKVYSQWATAIAAAIFAAT